MSKNTSYFLSFSHHSQLLRKNCFSPWKSQKDSLPLKKFLCTLLHIYIDVTPTIILHWGSTWLLRALWGLFLSGGYKSPWRVERTNIPDLPEIRVNLEYCCQISVFSAWGYLVGSKLYTTCPALAKLWQSASVRNYMFEMVDFKLYILPTSTQLKFNGIQLASIRYLYRKMFESVQPNRIYPVGSWKVVSSFWSIWCLTLLNSEFLSISTIQAAGLLGAGWGRLEVSEAKMTAGLGSGEGLGGGGGRGGRGISGPLRTGEGSFSWRLLQVRSVL